MQKIEKLTDEQISQFPRFVKEWTEIGLCTKPADRPRAEASVRLMYERGELKPPAKIVWCESPLSMALTRYILLQMQNEKASVRASVGASVRASVWDSVRASVGAIVGDSVGESVRDSVRASVGASVGAIVGASVWDSVRASVGDSVGAIVGAIVGDSVWDSVYGQHDAGWLAFYRYFHDVTNLTLQTQRLDGLWEFSQSAGWALPFRDICFISERHTTLCLDERGRLHCENGSAVRYPDGWSIYAIHGVRLPAWVIETPSEITVEKIHAEQNSEIQRVMIERYGWDQYADDCGAEIMDHDERYGTLMRRGDDCLFVKVINRSPEPDGSFRRYILPVDAQCRPLPDPDKEGDDFGEPQKLTALAAVASTFGMYAKDYKLMVGAES